MGEVIVPSHLRRFVATHKVDSEIDRLAREYKASTQKQFLGLLDQRCYQLEANFAKQNKDASWAELSSIRDYIINCLESMGINADWWPTKLLFK